MHLILDLLRADYIPAYVSLVLQVALAFLLVAIGGRSFQRWALAAFLILNGFWDLGVGVLAVGALSPAEEVTLSHSMWPTVVGATFTFLLFATSLTELPLGRARRVIRRILLVLTPVAVLVAWWRPCAIKCFEVQNGDVVIGSIGPLVLWQILWFPALLTTAVFLLIRDRQEQDSDRRASRRLLAMACLAYPITFLAPGFSWLLGLLPVEHPIGAFELAISVLCVAVSLASVAVALWAAMRFHREDPGTGWSRAMAAFGLLAPIPGMVHLLLSPVWGGGATIILVLFVLPLWYAVLRYRVFDLDVKLKWTISRGTGAAVILASAVAAIEVVGEMATSTYGYIAGAVVIFVLLLAYQPLSRAGARLADRALPMAEHEGVLQARKEAVYRAMMETLMTDGVVSFKERGALLRLQKELGLEANTANALEAEFVSAARAS